MADFQFLFNPTTTMWVVSAPRRGKRHEVHHTCPFCVEGHIDEDEVYRIGGNAHDSHWMVRAVKNKYPFAPIHEVIIHSPDHTKSFDHLPLKQVELILQVFQARYNEHRAQGQVYIFHNHGKQAGESVTHPHSQLAVIPHEVRLAIPYLEFSPIAYSNYEETKQFYIFCPELSQWPDEVWIAPKKQGRVFGEITEHELTDLSFLLQQLIRIFDLRHNGDFPFNFYIYPGSNWYLRLIPRVKTLGGFEVGTGVFVNTQKPSETMDFIRTHFHRPDREKILSEHTADYHDAV